MRQREQLGEATLDVSGTFPGEAIRLPIQIAALQSSRTGQSDGSMFVAETANLDEGRAMVGPFAWCSARSFLQIKLAH
jgi:hypothetical protein